MAVHGMYYTFGLTPIVGVKNSDVSVAFCFVPSKQNVMPVQSTKKQTELG